MEIIKQEVERVTFYACTDPAWSGARHGFSTRLGGVSGGMWESLNLGVSRGDDPDHVRENYRRFLKAIGAPEGHIAMTNQVHGGAVRTVTTADVRPDPCGKPPYEADGLMTDLPGTALVVFSADCIVILLHDREAGCVGAVHAGWRGTAKAIVQIAVEAMAAQYGADPARIRAAIGPGIGPCCFETHSDVPEGLRPGLGEEAEELIRPLAAPGKFSVDLKGANARWLERAGLARENIAICSACTACHLDEFWSHRVQGSARGSMAAMIQLV